MGVIIELRVLELLASRICHDLISPIGAIGNGLELLEDADPDMSGDALKLSANCVRKASALLEFFRMAYGTAGSDAGLRWDAAKQLAEGLLEGGKIALVWTPVPAGVALPPLAPKLALNLALLATEMLPRGGEIVVALQPADGRAVLSAVAGGREARIPEEIAAAMAAVAESVPPLTARTVHGFFTARLAEASGGRLEVVAQPAAIQLSIPIASV
ncbi:MAG: histidine phosphotransferase family protein [Dongiaceae bacterium]